MKDRITNTQAQEALKNGKKIRHESWETNEFIFLNELDLIVDSQGEISHEPFWRVYKQESGWIVVN